MIKTPAKNLQSLYLQLGDTSHDVRNKNLYELLLSYLRGNTLLDIGCGVGHFINLAKQNGYEVEGVEPDQILIEMSHERYGNIGTIYHHKAEEIGGINKKYHTITLIDVLEHVKDDGALLRLIRLKLVPQGRLIIFVPAYQFLYSDRDREIGHFRRYYASQIKKLLVDTGYEVKQIRYWNMLGFFVYGLFEKILKRNIHFMRTAPKKTGVRAVVHRAVQLWMRYIENKFNIGFGLSLLVIAEPK